MSTEGKKPMTDEERLALAEKLDADLDAFIDSLEKRQYKDGWNEDTWEEEMSRHPFFMKKLPDNPDDITLDPLTEGLQKLKYDPEENTSDDLASTYKEDGNFYVKHKKFRLAVMSYTEGLRLKTDNPEMNATLYNNRSAAQYFLKNYRSSFLDAKKAYELNPPYLKAKIRAAQCANEMNRFDECLDLCDSILTNQFDNKQIIDLRKNCVERKTKKQRDERKLTQEAKKKTDQLNRTLHELKKRKIKFEKVRDVVLDLKEDDIQPRLAPVVDFPVTHHDNGNLQWPLVFCYPEFLTTDFQQRLDENVILDDVLGDMFREPLEYDKERKYYLGNLRVYYENRITGKVHIIETRKSIKDIVDEKFFYVIDGCLLFYILAKDSPAETEFVNQQRRPLKMTI